MTGNWRFSKSTLLTLVCYVRVTYFRNVVDGLISVACIALAILFVLRTLNWAVIDSVWTAKDGGECAARGSGACWAVIAARIKLIFFGLYPHDELWRPAIGCVVLVLACVASCTPKFWSLARITPIWITSFLVFLLLMHGGGLGLAVVPDVYWGGMALTFFVFASMLIFGVPFAYLLALGRQSKISWFRDLIGTAIDLVRALPLVVILFGSWLLIPMMIPTALQISTLARALVGFFIFFASYEAEVLRGGLQAIGHGQEEAAKSLGMRFWQYQLTVILPQVFRISLPQTMNLIVGSFKDTSYIAIVGLFDVVAAANTAVGSGDWNNQFVEVYVVVALFFLTFGISLSRYGTYLERKMETAYRH